MRVATLRPEIMMGQTEEPGHTVLGVAGECVQVELTVQTETV